MQMTQSEYARRRGVTAQAIHALVLDGKIRLHKTRDGQRVLDVDEADKAIDETRQRPPEPPELQGGGDAGGVPVVGLTRARTATEVYRARLQQLEFEERVGRLARVEAVTRSMERCAEIIVRDLERLPLAADDLAVAYSNGGVAALRGALRNVVREIRKTIADNMRLLSADDLRRSGAD